MPYGMPASMMVGLNSNQPSYSDIVAVERLVFNRHNASDSNASEFFRTGGIIYIPHDTLSLNLTSMMAMRQQMDESNHELVNTQTQQMGIIFNHLVINTNQSYEALANKMDRIKDFFGAPHAQTRPMPQISDVRQVETPEIGTAQNLGQPQGL